MGYLHVTQCMTYLLCSATSSCCAGSFRHIHSAVCKRVTPALEAAERKTNPLSTVVIIYAVVILGIKFKSKKKCRDLKIWKYDLQTCSTAQFALELFHSDNLHCDHFSSSPILPCSLQPRFEQHSLPEQL